MAAEPVTVLQVATLVVAGIAATVSLVSFVVSYFSYRLAVRNQAQPLRQELYKRQADAFGDIIQGHSRLDTDAMLIIAKWVNGNKAGEDGEKARMEFSAKIAIVLRENLKHTPFIPEDFAAKAQAHTALLNELVYQAEVEGKKADDSNKQLDLLLRLLGPISESSNAVLNSARSAMGTEIFTKGNAKLIDLHKRDEYMAKVLAGIADENTPLAGLIARSLGFFG
jgi:hypothetical protein